MPKLTAVSIKQLKKTGRYSDGDGLYLQVRETRDPDNPNKSWVFRWGAGGKNNMGLGTLKDVTLAEARTIAAAHHRMVTAGQDPRQAREQQRIEAQQRQEALTFEEASKSFIELKRDGWKNKKHAEQWVTTLRDYAHPELGSTPCDEVTTEQVLNILRPIWTTKHETASRLRGRIESVLNWAAVTESRTGDNPARWKGKLELLLPEVSRRRRIGSFTFNCEAILTAGDGAGVGKVFHYFNGAFDFHQRVYMLNNFKDVIGKYLFHYFKENFYKVALEGGAKSTVDSLRRPMLLNFSVCIPSLPEQEKIVQFVEIKATEFDQLVEEALKTIELLRERRSALISAVVIQTMGKAQQLQGKLKK